MKERIMRKLIVGEFISLDGVVEAPEKWHFPYVNEEMFDIMWSLQATVDTMLLGRVTYQSYAGAFANAPAGDQIAARMNKPAKVVVSRTLHNLEWGNSTLLSGDVAAAVASLKEQPGGDIITTGSTSLVRILLRAGLVDELHLFTHPIVVGTGQRLFEDEGIQVPLTLTECRQLSTGTVYLAYRES
jgi:dihydrofolate reductase